MSSLRSFRLDSQRVQHTLAAGLLVAMGGLLFASMRDESPTTDEIMHVTRGVAFYWGRGASLSYAHPPLGNAFAALPIVLLEPPHKLAKVRGYARGDVDRVAQKLFEHDYAARRAWYFQARSMVALLTLGLGLYLYAFGRALYGGWVALTALFLFAFHPTLIAHGRLVTTDMPVTAAMTIAACELVLFLVGRARWHALTAALAAGIAFATKYTALALLPVLGALALGFALLRVGRYVGLTRSRALLQVCGLGVLVALVGLLVINAAYGFHRTGLRAERMLQLPEPRNAITAPFRGQLLEEHSVVAHLPGWFRVPLPYTYLFGVASIHAHDDRGHVTSFFGTVYEHGHPGYFPVLLAIKTPVLVLAGLLCALWLLLRSRSDAGAAALGCYAVALLLLASRSSINIGVRHVLPIMPVLCLLAAVGAVAVYRAAGASVLRTRLVLCLLGAQVWAMTWTFPDYLSDFNVLVGGRQGGHRISVIGEEWDQDMVRLGEALQAAGVTRLLFNLSTLTSKLELDRFGVEVVGGPSCGPAQPPGAFIAVSAREWARDTRGCFDWLSEHTPLIEINGHVWVFQVDEAPTAAALTPRG